MPRSSARPVAGMTAGQNPIALIPDSALITLNSLEILGIVYLAIALSKLRERIARIEGKDEVRKGD